MRRTRSSFLATNLVEDRHPHVTIFATGSLGRHEVGEHSDLDVFIVDAAGGEAEGGATLTNLQRLELLADLIRAGTAAGFPPFSRDGEFLSVHRLSHLVDFLGRPDEDHLNLFTARMLLLLESECLVGVDAYERCLATVLDRYWAEDEDKHDFRPTILINDIVRYWKTLTLSYEGWRRGLKRPLAPDERIDLLKLKFNRLWLCFVGLSYLLLGDEEMRFSRAHARRLVELRPVDRMLEIEACAFRRPVEVVQTSAERLDPRRQELSTLIASILEHYAWWLERTAPEKSEQESWIAADATYRAASEAAREFGDQMWRMVMLLGDRVSLTRYLLM